MINKLLIANRGEIAVRIIHTAKRLGINTIAIYSDIDKHSKFVQMADKAYRVGEAASLKSYLRDDKIIEIAKNTNSQAIHPGFGFLSENAQFADSCEKNNIIFVGPPSSAIRKMGSKKESKIIMEKANVPVVPGYHGDNQDPTYLREQATKIGYPVLIKAVLGGGGKGMRIVQSEDKFYEMLDSAKEESMNSFKDDKVILEKYITKPRHIEVQIFGDQFGNYVHLFERDCSIQRRHQKVVEEAPSNITQELREKICKSAIDAARAVNYFNAGTVEFIFDLDAKKYYFMEMNTRLQVEHPISEMISGQDFVEWQIKVASKFQLPIIDQNQLKINGHAIEGRVYSEDPFNHFIPDSGKLTYYREPKHFPGLRIDSGIRPNDEISPFYDPMISKLIVWGQTRQEALNKFTQAVGDYRVLGLPTNLSFLRRISIHQEFQDFQYDTGFIQKNINDLVWKETQFHNEDLLSLVVSKIAHDNAELPLPKNFINFRNSYNKVETYQLKLEAKHVDTKIEKINVEVTAKKGNIYDIKIKFNKDEYVTYENVQYNKINENTIEISTSQSIFQREFFAQNEQVTIFDEKGDPIQATFVNFEYYGQNEQSTSVDDPTIIRTSINCTLRKVDVKEGDIVEKGDKIIVVEVMKQHHEMYAQKKLKVKKVNYSVGDSIKSGQIVVQFEEI